MRLTAAVTAGCRGAGPRGDEPGPPCDGGGRVTARVAGPRPAQGEYRPYGTFAWPGTRPSAANRRPTVPAGDVSGAARTPKARNGPDVSHCSWQCRT